ncbi:uncharacterized protein DEA37_0008482 [Paragonimus westermani]|uniref:Dynein heavy chain tail domain-containing protein n=1 Tax=Paragonimus westermani TaxID=34504 RepID=A0A5J4P497_9TREM|nr:uncharacterized protein DEA37_0008482 [Paragonimus westermani]
MCLDSAGRFQDPRGACSCLTENVKLACCREVKSENLRDNTRFVELSQNLTSLDTVEECACRWMQQISLEVRELHLVRKESNTDGPNTEVKFWKRRMTRLNFLIDQLKLQEVINVKTILKLAQSKTLSAFLDLENKVLTACKEAKENVKFLQIVEKYCSPLYRCNIVSLTGNTQYFFPS